MGLIGKLKEKAMSALLAQILRGIAEGKIGPEWLTRLYWKTVGYKSYTGAILTIVATGLFIWAQMNLPGAQECWRLAMLIGAISTPLTALGLVDAAVRIVPPERPPWIKG